MAFFFGIIKLMQKSRQNTNQVTNHGAKTPGDAFDFFALLLVWPAAASIVLLILSVIFGLFQVNNVITIPANNDVLFSLKNIQVALYYSIAFIAYPIFMLFSKRKLGISNYTFMGLAAGGLVAMLVQYYWRSLSVGMSHLDCRYSCAASVIPQTVDESITTYTVLALVACYTFIMLAAYYFWRKRP